MAHTVAPLEQSDFERAVDTLTAAFMDDSALVEVIPNDALRARITPGLFAAMLRYTMRFGIVEQVDHANGIALWLGPRRIDVSPWQALRCGLARFVSRLDAGSRAYFLAKWGRLGKIHKELMSEPHRYLWTLGVHPERQGSGQGTALVESMAERARSNGFPLYLEAFHERNVDFYLGRGFEVVRTELIPGGNTRSCFMVYRSQAQPNERMERAGSRGLG